MNDLHDDLVFWEQVRNDGRRTILCAPERVDYVRGIVARQDPLGQFTVKPSNAVTGSMLIVVDENAFKALTNEAMAKPFGPFGGGWRTPCPLHDDLTAYKARMLYGARLVRPRIEVLPADSGAVVADVPAPVPAPERSWIRRALAWLKCWRKR